MVERRPLVVGDDGNPQELSDVDVLDAPAANIGGALVIGGGLSFKIEPLITATFNLTDETVVEADMASAGQFINLPPAADRFDAINNVGDVVVIKNSSTTGSFKIHPNPTLPDTIDGSTGDVTVSGGDSVWLLAKSDGWLII